MATPLPTVTWAACGTHTKADASGEWQLVQVPLPTGNSRHWLMHMSTAVHGMTRHAPRPQKAGILTAFVTYASEAVRGARMPASLLLGAVMLIAFAICMMQGVHGVQRHA